MFLIKYIFKKIIFLYINIIKNTILNISMQTIHLRILLKRFIQEERRERRDECFERKENKEIVKWETREIKESRRKRMDASGKDETICD